MFAFPQLKAMKASPSPGPVKTPSSNVKPPNSVEETVGSAKPALAVEASTSTKSGPGNTNIVEEGCSIYIRNLPQNATSAQLEDVFTKFEPIKRGGVQVRSNKQGFCFGFIEFESLSSMRSAIEASSIIIGSRKSAVEEKRTTTRGNAAVSGNNGRGRYPSSRDGFQNESFRGGRGGNYSGGSGFWQKRLQRPE